MRLLFDDDIPDPNDVAIVCLANACGLFAALLTKPELREVQARIDLISRMDLIGQAIVKVVRLAMPVFRDEEARALTEALPAAPGLPVIGNTLEAARDLLGLLERQYRALGPIFRIRVATADNTFLAGREANLFLLRKERFFLRASETLGNNCRALGSSRVVVGMDGGDHVRMRRALQGGISRDLFQSRLTEVVRIIRRQMAEWPQNVSLPGYLALQRLIVNQAGALSAGTLPGECLDDMVYLVDEILHDGFTPHMRNKVRFGKSRRRVEEFAGKLIASHQLHRRKREPDLVDDLIDLHRADPGFLAGVDLSLAALTPFLFATHTSSAVTAFIVYTLAKSPELKARVRAEAGELFGGEGVTAAKMRELDVIPRVVMEALRLRPVVPVLQRRVATSFEFAGYRVPKGGLVNIAVSLTHRMEEHFPEPGRFDIDRYLPERAEHRPAGVYAPFGLGLHRCLGAGMAEMQIALTVAALFHEAEFELDPPGYEMRYQRQVPLMFPHKCFRFRVTSRR